MSQHSHRLARPKTTSPSPVAVVTGATGGLGKEIVRGLLAAGITVIVGVRNLDKGAALQRDLAVAHGPDRVEVLPLDVADMQSVREFAAAVASRHDALVLLINNAGAWFNDRATKDGHELTLATNVLGPYLLTQRLLPLLQANGRARIVNVVSAAVGDFDVSDLNWIQRKYDAFKAYRQSKQALQMVTQSFALKLSGTGVVANAASPGFVRTSFLKDAKGFVAVALRAISFLAVTPAKGAETPLMVALSPELSEVSGRLYDGGKEKAPVAYDQQEMERLIKLLDEMTIRRQP
jgi:NAD(P)-dependent dehydrogenase (short-subunit alcohol dehydrogenase family)